MLIFMVHGISMVTFITSKEDTFKIMSQKEHALNAGCMINYHVPVTFDELIENNMIFKANDDLGRD